MTQYERNLSNLSYTNKDFGQIYPELLDLVKKISYKWDPSVSDESDPGVVLLKLAALMADKNNYNIDKNILELFPLSVTQDENARQIFEQCGYYMKHYISGTTTVAFTLVSEPEISENDLSVLSPDNIDIDLADSMNTRTYVIPMFTMISDADNNIVYTVTEDVTLQSNGITRYASAIQGIVNSFSINGETTITPSNLDYNNRIYLPGLDISQNGIFIADVHENRFDYRAWKQVDNLLLEPSGTKCYKFGITESGSSCYIEFPEDIENIIGNGISIKYVRTSGLTGNIGKNRLCQFYTDTTVERYIVKKDTQNINITADNVYVSNLEAVTNGFDPETIDEAYRNYQKVKETFKTLVSLKDYTDFLYTNKNVSNGYVCDRTNDISSCFSILSSDDNTLTHTFVKQIPTVVEEPVEGPAIIKEGIPELSAFDLRVYGLTYVANPTTVEEFNRTFRIINQSNETMEDWNSILSDTNDIKHLQHDYRTFEKNRILMIKNKYPIISKIIPTYRLTELEQAEITKSVISELCKALNSRNLDFGSPVDYSLVYDTILNSDPRIKAVTLDEIEYQTYASYTPDGVTIKEVRIDDGANVYEPVTNSAFVTGTDYYVKDILTGNYVLKSGLTSFAEDVQYYVRVDDSDIRETFRDEIYVQSVLAGKTQLFQPDTEFTFALNQVDSEVTTDITHVTTESLIKALPTNYQPVENGTSYPTSYRTGTIKNNENIVFTAPNTITYQSFGSYCKYITNIGQPSSGRPEYKSSNSSVILRANDEYTLTGNEYIIFFWKEEDSETSPYVYYKFDASSNSESNIVSPSFDLKIQTSPNNALLPPVNDSFLIDKLAPGKHSTDSIRDLITGQIDEYGDIKTVSLSLNDYVTGLDGSGFVLTGTRQIFMKKINKVVLGQSTEIRNLFWVLNDSTDDKCRLFDKGQDSYILKTGEYFMYTNSAKTQLVSLGYGTKITRSMLNDDVWECDKIDYDEFLSIGADYLQDKWFTITEHETVIVTEMMYHQIGPGNAIRLQPIEPETAPVYDYIQFQNLIKISEDGSSGGTFDPTGNPVNLANYSISYINETGEETHLPLKNNMDDSWIGYSLLNLDASSTTYQDISATQFVTLYTTDSVTKELVELRTLSATTIQSNRPISVTGGSFVDVTTVNLISKQRVPISIYSYSVATLDNSEWSVSDYSSTLTVTAGKGTSRTLPVSLPEGSYILPITLDKDMTLDIFKVNTDGSGNYKIKSVTNRPYNKAGTHYLLIDGGEGNLVVNTELTSDDSTITATIKFDKIFKFNISLTSSELSRRVELMAYLDQGNIFNYTYIVPQSDLIENPLKASSFIDSNHVFNRFTICQWNTEDNSNSKITVVNNVK